MSDIGSLCTRYGLMLGGEMVNCERYPHTKTRHRPRHPRGLANSLGFGMPQPPRTTPRLARPAAHAYYNACRDTLHTSPARSRYRRHSRFPRARGCMCRTSPRLSQGEDLEPNPGACLCAEMTARGHVWGSAAQPSCCGHVGGARAIIWGCFRPACLLSSCWLACSPT